jgi:hypothetical protein
MEAYFTLATVPVGTDEVQMWFKSYNYPTYGPPGDQDGFALFIYPNDWALNRRLASSISTLTSGTIAHVAGEEWRVTIQGSLITVWRRLPTGGWTYIGSATDSNHPKGWVGFEFKNTSGSVDNFGTGPLTNTVVRGITVGLIAPSTPVLDTFSGTLNNFNLNPWDSGKNISISSGKLVAAAGTGGGMAWSEPFAVGDIEVYITLVNASHNGNGATLVLGSALNGPKYTLAIGSDNGDWEIRRYSDDYTQVSLATGVQNNVSGDKFCFQRRGTMLYCWHYKLSTTTWTMFYSINDATYNDICRIGFIAYEATNQYDDFGGGNPGVAADAGFSGFSGTALPVLRDTFTRGDGPLTNPWYIGELPSNVQVLSNKAAPITGGENAAWLSGVSSADLGLSFKIDTLPSYDYGIYAHIASMTGNAKHCYQIYLLAGGTQYEIYQYTGQKVAPTALGATFATGDEMGVRITKIATGNRIRVYRRAGGSGSWSAALVDWTDTSPVPTAPFFGGIGSYGGSTARIDDFRAEKVTYPYMDAVRALSPRAYWPDLAAADRGGCDLVVEHGTVPTAASPVPNGRGARTFNRAAGGQLEARRLSSLDFVGDVPCSWVVWVKPSGVSQTNESRTIVEQRDNSSPLGGWQLYQGYGTGAQLVVCVDGGSAGEDEPAKPMFSAAATWVMAVLTYDGTDLTWYKDAVQSGVTYNPTVGFASSGSSVPLRVGSSNYSNTFDGDIAELAIFDTCLTLTQIQTLFVAGGGSLGATVPIGKRASATVVKGVTVAATGAVAVTIGRRAAATTVKGVTVAASGAAPITIGKRAAATVVKGVTVSATGAAPVAIGSRASATSVKGVTVTATGAALVTIGRRASATSVKGITLVAVGAAPLAIGRAAPATSVKGVTVSGSGTVTLAIGSRASATSVKGVTVSGSGTATPIVIGRRASATATYGITVVGSGTITLAIGRRASATVIPGIVLVPSPVSIPIGRVAGGLPAFTSAAQMDKFNRADGSAGANWATGINAHVPGFTILSGQLRVTTADNAFFATQYGPDTDVAIDLAVAPGSGQYIFLALRIKDEGTNAWDGYGLIWIQGTGWQIRSYTNGSSTVLGSTVTGNDLVSGDRIGFRAVGNTLTGYRYTGGAWVVILTRTDSTYTNAGYTGLEISDSNQRLDNFVAGTIVAVGGSIVYGVTLTGAAVGLTIGARAAATVVGGVTLAPSGAAPIVIGRRASATSVKGVTVAGFGTAAPIVIGSRASATSVKGVTVSGSGTVTLAIGRRVAATTVRGVTAAAVGAAPLAIGRVVAATVTRGVTLVATGAAPIAIGRRASATVVKGITLAPAGAAPITIGSRASATSVKGITLSATGTVNLAIGRRAAATTVGGIVFPGGMFIGKRAAATTVRGIQGFVGTGIALITIGSRASATTTRGVTVSGSGTITLAIGRRAPQTTVRGLTLVPGTLAVSIGKRNVATTVNGIFLLYTQFLPIGKRNSVTTVRGVVIVPAPVSFPIGRRAAATTVYGVTTAPTGAVLVPIGRRGSSTVIRGITLVGAAVVAPIGHVLSRTIVYGVNVRTVTIWLPYETGELHTTSYAGRIRNEQTGNTSNIYGSFAGYKGKPQSGSVSSRGRTGR